MNKRTLSDLQASERPTRFLRALTPAGAQDQRLRAAVFEALNNAVINGYDFDGWTAEAVAQDLINYDSDLEGCEIDELLPFVIEWRKTRKAA